MKVLKEVEVSDDEVNDLILREMYNKDRIDFYNNINVDHYDYEDYEQWRRRKYDEILKNK